MTCERVAVRGRDSGAGPSTTPPDIRSASEQRVDERCNRRSLCQDNETAEYDRHNEKGKQPELFALLKISPELRQKIHGVSPLTQLDVPFTTRRYQRSYKTR